MKHQSLYLRFFSLIIIWIVFSCKEVKPVSRPLSERERLTYEVIDACLSKGNITEGAKVVRDNLYPVMLMPNDPVEIARGSKSFTPEDIIFIAQQAAEGNVMKLDADKMQPGIQLISSEYIDALSEKYRSNEDNEKFWKAIEGKYGDGFISFSKPFFSKDFRTAIIAIDYACGSFCGRGAVYIVVKQENGWFLKGIPSQWIR